MPCGFGPKRPPGGSVISSTGPRAGSTATSVEPPAFDTHSSPPCAATYSRSVPAEGTFMDAAPLVEAGGDSVTAERLLDRLFAAYSVLPRAANEIGPWSVGSGGMAATRSCVSGRTWFRLKQAATTAGA